MVEQRHRLGRRQITQAGQLPLTQPQAAQQPCCRQCLLYKYATTHKSPLTTLPCTRLYCIPIQQYFTAMTIILPKQPLNPQPLPYFLHRVRAGFPSPADDYVEQELDLIEHLIKHPAATYFVRAQGDSMEEYGIFDGDLLIVDRSVEAIHGDVVIAVINGELTCKVLDIKQQQLLSGNSRYPPIPCGSDVDMVTEGVVLFSVRYHRVCSN